MAWFIIISGQGTIFTKNIILMNEKINLEVITTIHWFSALTDLNIRLIRMKSFVWYYRNKNCTHIFFRFCYISLFYSLIDLQEQNNHEPIMSLI